MPSGVEVLKQAQGTVLVDSKGRQRSLKLMPPASPEELKTLETKAGFTYPAELRELLLFTRGFEGLEDAADLSSPITFDGGADFGLDDVFPRGLTLGVDICGNHWILDLLGAGSQETAVYYACHDPPVMVYQAASIGEFIAEFLRLSNAPWESAVSQVLDEDSRRIWNQNPDVLSHAEAIERGGELALFAKTLDETWQIIDLREAKIGDGFSWGRYGAETENKRFGTQRIFGYQIRKLNWFQRIFAV